MNIEIEEMKEELDNIENRIIDGFEFFVGKLEGVPIVISKTNVGLIDSGLATFIGIKEFKPSLIINQGTARRLWRIST